MSFFKKAQPVAPEPEPTYFPGSQKLDMKAGEAKRITDPVFELAGSKGNVLVVDADLGADDPNYYTILRSDGHLGRHGSENTWLFTTTPATVYVAYMASYMAEEERIRKASGKQPIYPPVGTAGPKRKPSKKAR